MSNQPKITYRSDTTGCIYQMMMHYSGNPRKGFTIQAVNMDGIIVHESHMYDYVFPWRKTIDKFFDIVDHHINRDAWVPVYVMGEQKRS